MEVSETIQCPYCGQSFDLAVDTSIPKQRFTTDCEVCCRPFEVVAECEPGEALTRPLRWWHHPLAVFVPFLFIPIVPLPLLAGLLFPHHPKIHFPPIGQ
jgi:hypothetical protein